MSRSIYVISSQRGPVKVGVTSKPKSRLSELSTASAVPLKLEFVGDCHADAAEKIEALAHKILSAQRTRGEWFNISVEEAVKAVLRAASDLGYEIFKREIKPRQRIRLEERKHEFTPGTELEIADAVIAVMGGLPGTRQMVEKAWGRPVTQQRIHNWKVRNGFPANTYLLFEQALKKRGFTALKSLWGQF